MNTKHRKTLEAVFAKPTRGNIVFGDLEALVKEAKMYQVEALRAWLESLEVKP